MEQVHDRVAGLDVHRDVVAVCVRVPGARGGTVTEKERFQTTTSALARLSGWLGERHVTLVAMEATGVYWKPVYYALECSHEVWLCNAHHVKNVPGRKTDQLTELPGGSVWWSARSPAGMARFLPRDHRRGYSAGVVDVGGGAPRVA